MRGSTVSFGIVLSLVLRPERASSLLPSARRRPRQCPPRGDAPSQGTRPRPAHDDTRPSQRRRQRLAFTHRRRRTTGLRSRGLLDEEEPALAAADAAVDLGLDGGEGRGLGRPDGGRTAREAIEEAASEEFRPMLLLCCAVTFLSALDRVAMSVAILPMASELAFTETVKGEISAAVSYGYGLAIVPIGLAVSFASTRVLMSSGVLLWSLATLGTPWAAGLAAGGGPLAPLLATRAVMGAAEAAVLPTIQRVLANWVPPGRKAGTLATVISGFQLGTVGAYVASPYLIDALAGLDGGGDGAAAGWRGMFYAYGALGLLWLAPWWNVAKDYPSTRLPSEESCSETLVNSGVEDDASLVLNECLLDGEGLEPEEETEEGFGTILGDAPWLGFLRSSGVWAMVLAHAAKNWNLYIILAWAPTFFSQEYGLDVKESALLSLLPSMCGIVGGLSAGKLADYALVTFAGDEEDPSAAIEKRTAIRKVVQGIALLGPALCLYQLSSLPDDVSSAQLLLGGTVGLQAFDAAGFGAATQEKSGERWAGLLYSVTSLPGVLVGSAAVSVTGRILDASAEAAEGWHDVYLLNSAICTAGALAFVLLYDSRREFD